MYSIPYNPPNSPHKDQWLELYEQIRKEQESLENVPEKKDHKPDLRWLTVRVWEFLRMHFFEPFGRIVDEIASEKHPY